MNFLLFPGFADLKNNEMQIFTIDDDKITLRQMRDYTRPFRVCSNPGQQTVTAIIIIRRCKILCRISNVQAAAEPEKPLSRKLNNSISRTDSVMGISGIKLLLKVLYLRPWVYVG